MSFLPLWILAGLALGLVAAFMAQPRWQAWRRERIAGRPFPAAWREILRRRVPQYRRLPADLQLQLKRRIQVFLAEKAFIGCQGQVVTDEVRVTIAAQACLLLLNRSAEVFPGLRQILVYPGAFMVDRVRPMGGGVLRDERQVLSGESWSQGQVILSWQDAVDGAAVPDDGRNVVIHEFAHQLDQETGAANGAPELPRGLPRRHWAQVLGSTFAELQRQVALGEETLLGAYAATEPAEFFAVATEVFYEQPAALAAAHPALYGCLRAYYQVDPQAW